jgi:alkyldihydroxyacetonephosphate synthase
MGPDLRHLFMGAEGTLGVITEVTLKIFPVAASQRFEAFAFASVEEGIDALHRLARTGTRPLLVRLYDRDESCAVLQDSTFTGSLLLSGCEGPTKAVVDAEHELLSSIVAGAGGTPLGPGPVETWMQRRFDFSHIENLLASSGGYADTIEVAHRWSKIEVLYQALKTELSVHAGQVLGHFSHIYPQGTSLYLIVMGTAGTDTEAAVKLEEISRVAMVTTLGLGGVISHHHGLGLARARYVPDALASSLPILQAVKKALDPVGILNPGKLGLGSI